MAFLPSCFFAALLPQTPRLFGIPISCWRFVTRLAVLGYTPFQFMQTRAQLLYLFSQLLVFCSSPLVLLPQFPVLSLKLFYSFGLTHDFILIVQGKGRGVESRLV
jgi:hypothetical protein